MHLMLIFKNNEISVATHATKGAIEEHKGSPQCIACLENTVAILAYPWCHLCLCEDWADIVMNGAKKWPMCRNLIISTVKINKEIFSKQQEDTK